MSWTRRNALAALPAAAFLPAFAGAQPTAQPIAAPSKDPLLAPFLLSGGRKQIENCSYALKKLQSDEAKAFAKAEIDEHETIKKNLKGLGYDYPVTAAPGTQPNQPTAWSVTAGAAKLPTETAAMVAVDHEVADRCILNYRSEMDKLSGKEFDKRFIGHQLDEHMTLLDKCRRSAATPPQRWKPC
ncbi:DUF4142 domain-containing protein [Gemmata sp. JC717]|uniref:DUF4142 domain-containing protein n=1 Tax=Gemmata algarum TaxID=2975278 RepID=UPI0021BA447B|nr:DUF4142 domain-containing protein [Gemmata algarum]MDY3557107.1 DUF4142 domain-containing protein [Gemmata algarum]